MSAYIPMRKRRGFTPTVGNNVLKKYIYCFLRTKIIRKLAQSFFSGSAGQQRVGANFLEQLVMPVPPLEIQNHITDKIFTIKSQIKELRNNADALRNQAKLKFEEEVFGE